MIRLVTVAALAGALCGPAAAQEPPPRYARIEDLPELPKYTEVEPGQPRPTLEEKPRPRQQLLLP